MNLHLSYIPFFDTTDYRNRSFQYFCMKFSQAVELFMLYAVTERIFGNYGLLRRFPN